MREILPYLFPDAASVWGGIATLAGLLGVLYGALTYHHRRRLDQEPMPIVSVAFDRIPSLDNWFVGELTISNPLPFSISCKEISIIKTRVGLSLRESKDIRGHEQYTWPISEISQLAAAEHDVKHSIGLKFRIERTGFDPKPDAMGAVSTTGDRETRSFFLFRFPAHASTKRISMQAQLQYYDSRNRRKVIKFSGELP